MTRAALPSSLSVSSVARPLRLLLIGAPGSGKGTQASKILRDFTLPNLSSGDLLRKNIAEGTAAGKEAEACVAQGSLVPDGLMVQLVERALLDLANPQGGWLLDGFPRTVGQAKALDHTLEDKLYQPLTRILHLDVSHKVILQRILDRWVHIPSGRVYNMTYNPPKVPGKDDVTGDPLSKRPDDDPVIFERRLEQYARATEPLLEYYTSRGIVKTVQGETSDVIYQQVHAILQEDQNKGQQQEEEEEEEEKGKDIPLKVDTSITSQL